MPNGIQCNTEILQPEKIYLQTLKYFINAAFKIQVHIKSYKNCSKHPISEGLRGVGLRFP